MTSPEFEALLKHLRSLSQEQAFDEVVRQIDGGDWYTALEVARRVLRRRDHFLQLLHRGILEADASAIQYWLRACVHALGPKRVLREMEDMAGSHPAAVHRATYYGAQIISEIDEPVAARTLALRKRLENA
ncbi:MAG TPA: hypothetical protein VM261_03540 [Kofleriaceae bacterium]|nr:hypothetical protein [Kofleriaceae bacterium]